MKYLNLFLRGLEVNWKALLEYKESFYMTLFAEIGEVIVAIAFWAIIFSMVPEINGWTLGQVILIQGFMQLFFGFLNMFFEGAFSLEHLIIRGKIDKHLVRPVEPLFIEIVSRMNLFSIINFIAFGIYLFVSSAFGVEIGWGILPGILICFLVSVIVGLMGICIQLLSFWIGKSHAIYGLFSIFWHFGDHPMTIFPMIIQKIFIFVIPLFVAASVPVMGIIGMITNWDIIQYILLMLGLIVFWTAVMIFMWKRGLKRYDSYGG